MKIHHALGCALIAFLMSIPALPSVVEAGPAYQPSGKHDDLPTYEGRIVSLNKSAGRISIRGDQGFRSFEVHPKKIGSLEKNDLVRISYEKVDSGRRAVVLMELDRPTGASSEEAIAESKKKLAEQGIIPTGAGAPEAGESAEVPAAPEAGDETAP